MGTPSDSLPYAMKVRLGLIVESPKRRARVGRVTTGKRAFALARMSIHADGESLTATLPIRTYSEANMRDNRWDKSKRVKSQREAVYAYLKGKPLPPLPVVVTLTRIGKNELDPFDNLPRSMKACADEIATLYGIQDNDPRITFVARQVKAKEYGLVVQIERKP